MLRLAVPVLLACAAAAPAHARRVAEEVARNAGIVPDIFDKTPSEIVEVNFNGRSVNLGNFLTPSQVANLPKFSWKACSNAYYCVLLVDPDAPSPERPEWRSFLHYLICNVPGKDVSAGTTLAHFTGSNPPEGSGPHRYVFLVYKQPKKIDFQMTPITNPNSKKRRNFSVRKFAKEHDLDDPEAWNFYYSEFQNEGLSSLKAKTDMSLSVCASFA